MVSRNIHKICLTCLAVAVLMVSLFILKTDSATSVHAQDEPTENRQYLPIVLDQVQLSWRMAFASEVANTPITRYPEMESLKAGAYLDWTVRADPLTPQGMEYIQLVRMHQNLTCDIGTTPDRTECPYEVPHDYTTRPSFSTIAAVAAAQPGSLWLLGNEMDRRDWIGGYQDEMLPELYAVAYHDLYTLIKEADPTAKVAIGGMIQATPLRLEYLTKAWDEYQRLYGEPMPVDVWNIHGFILPEIPGVAGADIPPGSDATIGTNVEGPAIHLDMDIFVSQIEAFRQWMKAHGQQEKPLIVSEYGALYHNTDIVGEDFAEDPQVVIDFMIGTFDYFLNTKDCELGYVADDCRLVQRWVWYSLDDIQGFNPYGRLFDPDTLEITPTGEAFRTFSTENLSELSKRID